jgi:hypothetical protein
MLLANPQFADDLILLYIKLKDNFDILIIIKKKKKHGGSRLVFMPTYSSSTRISLALILLCTYALCYAWSTVILCMVSLGILLFFFLLIPSSSLNQFIWERF